MTIMKPSDRIFVSGSSVRTGEQVFDRIARVASGLAKLGVGAGKAVAILMRNDVAFLEASAGASRLGGYVVPLNWHLAREEVSYVLDDCEANVLVVHADLLDLVLPSLIESRGITVIVVDTPPEIQAAYGLAPDR